MSSFFKAICLLLLVAVYGMLFGTLFFSTGDWGLVGIVCGLFWIAGGIYALLRLQNVDWTFIKKAALGGIVFYVVEMMLLASLGVL